MFGWDGIVWINCIFFFMISSMALYQQYKLCNNSYVHTLLTS
jgi:hypothetical protein